MNLTCPCRHGHIEVAKYLLELGPMAVCARDNYALRWACWNGHEALVTLLLAHAACVADRDFQPVKLAARNGHVGVLGLLLQVPGVNAAAEDNFAFRMVDSL